MQDEQHRPVDDLAIDDEIPSAADDAVSNRGDDTALEESRSMPASVDQNAADAADPLTTGAELEPSMPVDAAEQTDGIDEAEELDEYIEEEQGKEDDDPTAPAKPPLIEDSGDEEIRMDWYILKVQSNRERSIAEALERKMRIEGLDHFFDQVIVPTEKVTEFKGGKKKIVERKLYPGYVVVHMHINDRTWFAVRETSGVGDFTGSGGKPTPMLPHEVARIIQTEVEETSEAPKLDIKFSSGDKVKVKEGNFENFEGEVNTIDEASGRVTVMINIFGRSTPVELEYWQIEAV